MGYTAGILTLKMFDILLLTVYYFILAFYMATGMDYLLGKYDSADDDKKPTWRLMGEAIAYTFLLMVAFYVARNLIERIPFPFDGLWGFKHSRVKERGGDVVFIFLLFFYQEYYNKKLTYLSKRLMGEFNGNSNANAKAKKATA